MQIKDTDYSYDGFKLGDDVYLKDRKGDIEYACKIVGFDETAYSLCYAIIPLDDTRIRTKDRAMKLNCSSATTILRDYEHVTGFLWVSSQRLDKIDYERERAGIRKIIEMEKELNRLKEKYDFYNKTNASEFMEYHVSEIRKFMERKGIELIEITEQTCSAIGKEKEDI